MYRPFWPFHTSMYPEYFRPLRSTSPRAVPSLSTFSSFWGCFEKVLSRRSTRIEVSAYAQVPRNAMVSTIPSIVLWPPEDLRHRTTLFPPQNPEDERQHQADQNACRQGKVEGESLPLYQEVTGQLSEPGDPAAEHQQHAGSGQHD